eukprot:bmy_19229T0
MSAAEADRWAWLLVLCFVFGCNVLRILLPSFSSFAALMVTLIWTYYAVPVAVVPSRWITPLDRLVAFPTGVAGEDDLIEFTTVTLESPKALLVEA